MENPFPSAQSKYKPIHTNRFYTGLWTQRNPLRDAAVPFINERSGGGRYESLIDGLNLEMSSRLTLKRRPGHSIYNSQDFPEINRFYEFRTFSGALENIRVMADCPLDVYDATGPNTKTSIFTKSAGAGSTYFQAVGNTLFMGNGVDQKKWVQSAKVWLAATTFASRDFIVDSNLNIQVATGARNILISDVTIDGANLCTITTASRVALAFYAGMTVTFSGLTTATFLNGATVVILSVTYNQITFAFVHAAYPTASDTGTVLTAGGATAGVEPVWGVTVDAVTADGNEQWLCKGPSLQNWGLATPLLAPTVTNSPRPTVYQSWAADTIYSTSLSIVDGNGNIQVLTTGGITGAAEPVWSLVLGAVTADGTAAWTNNGPAAWAALTAFAVGDIIAVNWTYYITVPSSPYSPPPYHTEDEIPEVVGDYSYPVNASAFFQCTTAGNTAATQPEWIDGAGATVADGTLVWTNIGAQQTWAVNITALQDISLEQTVLDANFNLQRIVANGKSGATAPTWSTTLGQTTIDNTASWINDGPFSAAGSARWIYKFTEKNSVTNTISNGSPQSAEIIVAAGRLITVQGVRGTDPQTDTIQIFRTAQGGSSFFLLDEIPAPAIGATWTYFDSSFDNILNAQIQAETSNIVPPLGLINLTFHFQRIWGSIGNTVYYAGGPSVLNGAGNEAFRPTFSFIFPSSVRRLWSTAIGLLVFTVSDIYLIPGKGTSTEAFYSTGFLEKLGLLNYDAFCVNGSTANLMTTSSKVVSLDPGAGVTEIGFPIGDQFKALYDPATAFLTWHEGGSADTGLFASDGETGWFRMSPTSAPETGFMWSPKATIAAGCKAVQSVETSPGQNDLLVGPGAGGGMILKRDENVNKDNAALFAFYGTVGSLLVAQPGQVAEIDFITLDSIKVGTRPIVGLLLDEISGPFADLYRNAPDPPLLPASTTLYNDRYYTAQNQQPSYCRHLQIKFSWAAEDAANELLSYTFFGCIKQEKQ